MAVWMVGWVDGTAAFPIHPCAQPPIHTASQQGDTVAIELGNYVKVVDREATPADAKSGLFYNHFRNLAGVVDRIYDDGNLCVVVDHATLQRDMLARLK